MELLPNVNIRRLSLAESPPTSSPNIAPLQPSSSKVISNLISSLSSISTKIEDPVISPRPSPRVPSGFHSIPDRQNDIRSDHLSSLNVDHCSYDSQMMRERNWKLSLSNLSPPAFAVPTANPISGYSEPVFRQSHLQHPATIKNLLKAVSRPNSRGSDIETRGIGNLSIEPGYVSSAQTRKSNLDGWGKKEKRLTCMSNKDNPRKKDQPRNCCSISTVHQIPATEQPSCAPSPYEENTIKEQFPKASLGKDETMSSIFAPICESSITNPRVSKNGPFSRLNSYQAIKDLDDCDQESIKNKSAFLVYLDHMETLEPSSSVDGGQIGQFALSSALAQPAAQGLQSPIQSSERNKAPRDQSPHHRNAQQSVSLNPSRTARNSRNVSAESSPIDERPKSADSIYDAVQTYLYSPRLSQKIRHPQTGRTISFSEVGDSNGFAVFCCVGMGLTRYITAFYDELALTLKLRLITPDRPGVGESEPYSDGTSTPLSWPDDVYAICQALKINKFSIMAHSAGAIYALATALRMPQHIRGRIHLLAPWIPPSQMSVIGCQVGLPPNHSLPTSQRILRALPTPILKAANSGFMSAASSSMASSLPKQRRVKRKSAGREVSSYYGKSAMDNEINGGIDPLISEMTGSPTSDTTTAHLDSEAAILAAAANSLAVKERKVNYDSRLTNAIWNLATQGANPAVDLLVCLERRHSIGFRYVDITRAVVIHHGSKDSRVPVENVIWMGKTMKRCEVRVIEGEGHSLMTSASIMSSILTEIAQDWEDWTNATNSTGIHRNERTRKTLKQMASSGTFR